MSAAKNHVNQFERRALCHACYTSNVVCTAHPKTGLPECASCKDRRTNPNPAPAQETSNET